MRVIGIAYQFFLRRLNYTLKQRKSIKKWIDIAKRDRGQININELCLQNCQ